MCLDAPRPLSYPGGVLFFVSRSLRGKQLHPSAAKPHSAEVRGCVRGLPPRGIVRGWLYIWIGSAPTLAFSSFSSFLFARNCDTHVFPPWFLSRCGSPPVRRPGLSESAECTEEKTTNRRTMATPPPPVDPLLPRGGWWGELQAFFGPCSASSLLSSAPAPRSLRFPQSSPVVAACMGSCALEASDGP